MPDGRRGCRHEVCRRARSARAAAECPHIRRIGARPLNLAWMVNAASNAERQRNYGKAPYLSLAHHSNAPLATSSSQAGPHAHGNGLGKKWKWWLPWLLRIFSMSVGNDFKHAQ
jgi:hypothetical protein